MSTASAAAGEAPSSYGSSVAGSLNSAATTPSSLTGAAAQPQSSTPLGALLIRDQPATGASLGAYG